MVSALRRRAVAAVAVGAALALALAGCGSDSGQGAAKRGGAESGGAKSGAAKSSSRPDAGAWRYTYTSKDLNSDVTGLAAGSADDAWAVTTSPVTGDITDQRHTLLHYDGGEWRPYPLPTALKPAESIQLVRLDASGPDDVWLFAGDSGQRKPPFAAHWDGRQWRAVSVPADFPWYVTDAAVFAPDDVWAVDRTDKAWHWDGRAWRPVALPGKVTALAASSPTDMWAFGHMRTGERKLEYDGPAALHWDGHRWTSARLPEVMPGVATPAPSDLQGEDQLLYGADLTHAVAFSPHDVWAFGIINGEGGQDEFNGPLTLHYDGTRWVKKPQGGIPCCSLHRAGLLLLDAKHYMTGAGRPRTVAAPPDLPGRTGSVTAVDRKQRLRLKDVVLVPGTKEVWGVGAVTVESHGDANFSRGVVVRVSSGG